MSVIDELRLRANIIKQEEEAGENTALRVGSLLYDMIDYIDSNSGGVVPQPSEKTSVIVSPTYSGGVQIARIAVDGITQSLWAPKQADPTPGYDDSEIRGQIDNIDVAVAQLRNTANREQARLDGVIQEINTIVNEKIDRLYNDALWIQTMFPEHQVTWQSGWDQSIEAYLQRVGVWARDNGITRTQWSQITQAIDSLTLEVANVTQEAGNVIRTVSSTISQSVSDEMASYNIDATYSKKDVEDVILWMYSALKGGATEYSSWNELVSAGQAGANSAVSEVRTQVERIGGIDGELIAESNIVSKVNDSIAELYQRASATSSEATLFTQVKKDANQVSTWKTAGVVLNSTLDRSMATLLAEGGEARAAISTMVEDGLSTIDLTADRINAVTQKAIFEAAGFNVRAGDVGDPSKFVSIQTRGGDYDSRIDLTAENIYLGGTTERSKVQVDTANFDMTGFTECRIGDADSGKVTIESNEGIVLRVDEDSEGTINLEGDVQVRGTILSNRTLDIAGMTGVVISTPRNKHITVQSGSDLLLEAQDITSMEATEIEFHPVQSFTSDMALVVDSDERLKNIESEVAPSIEDIAKARIINYTLKNKDTQKESLGSIAQDWQEVLPNAVSINKDGYLGLDYAAAALASAVTAAREIVALKEENRLLKERLEKLENLILNK